MIQESKVILGLRTTGTQVSATLLSSPQASPEPLLGQAQESLRKFLAATRDLAQELLTLPSLMELRALLRRPRGSAGSLELVSEALCSTKGPSRLGGLSLNRLDIVQLNQFTGPEPAPALADSNLSEWLWLSWNPGLMEGRRCTEPQLPSSPHARSRLL